MAVSTDRHPALADALADLAALGVSEDARLGETFGVARARSNARWWIIPLCDRRQTNGGLDLFQPVSAGARAMKAGAQALCRLGLHNMAFRQKLRLSGTGALAASFPGGAAACAIYTGTDGPHRKTALQFTDARGRILGYGKLSRAATVIPWIEAEARMLDEIAAMRLVSADTPHALTLRQQNGTVLLLTDSHKGEGFTIPRTLGPAHAAFLTELAERTASDGWQDHVVGLRTQLAQVAAVMDPGWRKRMARALDQLADGPKLPLTLAHGDFTPWNSFLGNRLYVFDWEYAGRKAAGHDAIHFTLAANPKAASALLRCRALAVLGTHYPTLSPEAASQALLAYLCDHTLLFARREAESLNRQNGWDGAARTAGIMDSMESVGQ